MASNYSPNCPKVPSFKGEDPRAAPDGPPRDIIVPLHYMTSAVSRRPGLTIAAKKTLGIQPVRFDSDVCKSRNENDASFRPTLKMLARISGENTIILPGNSASPKMEGSPGSH